MYRSQNDIEKPFFHDFENCIVYGLTSSTSVKRKRSQEGSLVDNWVTLPSIVVVWITLGTYQTLRDAQNQAAVYLEPVDGSTLSMTLELVEAPNF